MPGKDADELAGRPPTHRTLPELGHHAQPRAEDVVNLAATSLIPATEVLVEEVLDCGLVVGLVVAADDETRLLRQRIPLIG
jgi:hypothetical protein